MEDIAPVIEKEWQRPLDNEITNEDWEHKDMWTKILKKEMTRLKWRVFLTMRCFTSHHKDEKIAKKFKKIVLLYIYLHSSSQDSQDDKKKFVEASVKWFPTRIVHLIKREFCGYGGYWIYSEDSTILKHFIFVYF